MPFYKSSGHRKYSKPRQLTFSLEFNPPKERKKEKKKKKKREKKSVFTGWHGNIFRMKMIMSSFQSEMKSMFNCFHFSVWQLILTFFTRNCIDLYTLSHGSAMTANPLHHVTRWCSDNWFLYPQYNSEADPCTLSHGSAVTDNLCILLVTILQRKAAFNPFIRCGSYRWPLHPVILWFRDSWPLHLVSHNISVTADPYILLVTIFQWQLTLTSC